MHFEKLSPWLGAEVLDFDIDRLLSGGSQQEIAALRAGLEDHRMLRLRGVTLTPETFVALARCFGPVGSLRRADGEGTHFPHVPEIKLVANGYSADGTKLGDGDASENSWHTDGSYLRDPTQITFLYGRKTPVHPPRTVFLDLIEAYRQLPRQLKDRIAGRRAIHYSVWNHDAADASAIAELTSSAGRKAVGPSLPLVVTHPASGLPVLMPPRQPDCLIDGLDAEQSRALAQDLWDFLSSLDCAWGDVIQPDDLVFWDNRFLLHMREAFKSSEERVVWHTTTTGAHYAAYLDEAAA